MNLIKNISLAKFKSYKDIVFDFDGVFVDSNNQKELALKKLLLSYGGCANAINDSLIKNKGKNRKSHFDFVFPSKRDCYKSFSYEYSKIVDNIYSGLDIAVNISALKFKLNNRWSIISSANKTNIINVLNDDIQYFENGIYGDLPKEVNFKKLDLATQDTLIVGDGIVDASLSKYFNVDFLYIKKFSSIPKKIIPNFKYYELNELKDILK